MFTYNLLLFQRLPPGSPTASQPLTRACLLPYEFSAKARLAWPLKGRLLSVNRNEIFNLSLSLSWLYDYGMCGGCQPIFRVGASHFFSVVLTVCKELNACVRVQISAS